VNPEEEAEFKYRQARVAAALETLREEFDCVQILAVSALPDDRYHRFSAGSGLWLTRYGMMKEWLDETEERSRIYVAKQEGE
jgi:hypothetical protein